MASSCNPAQADGESSDVGNVAGRSADHADRHFVTALARGLQLLQCFQSGEEHLGNQELARRCALPKSTVARLTYTLTRLGFLHHDAEAGRYRLGLATLALGGTTLSRLDAMEASRAPMQQLADRTGCLVALSIRDGMSMLYIGVCRSRDALLTMRIGVGSRVPIATSAMGRAYLASAKPVVRKGLVERLRALDPQGWPRLDAGLQQAQAEYALHGCCASFSEWRRGVNAIAAPLRAGKDMPRMLLCVAGPPTTARADSMLQEMGPMLLAAVQQAEGRLRGQDAATRLAPPEIKAAAPATTSTAAPGSPPSPASSPPAPGSRRSTSPA